MQFSMVWMPRSHSNKWQENYVVTAVRFQRRFEQGEFLGKQALWAIHLMTAFTGVNALRTHYVPLVHAVENNANGVQKIHAVTFVQTMKKLCVKNEMPRPIHVTDVVQRTDVRLKKQCT